MNKMPSLDQQRAAYAWKVVQGQNGEYGKLAKGAPALIMNNGLMQALAFYEEKGKAHQAALNKHIIDWLWERRFRRDEGVAPTRDSFGQMMAYLQNDADSQTYRKATEETLALLRWIRQFAAISR